MSAPPDELPGRSRLPVRPARLVLAVLTVLLAVVVVLPDLVGLDHRSPFAQLVAFRPAMLAGLLVLGVAAAVAAVVRRRGWTLAGGLLAVAVIGGALVLPRALATAPEPQARGRTLTVLAFNTYEGDGAVDAVAALVRESRPDLIALPEAGGRYRDRLEPLLPEYRFVSSNERGRDVQNVVAAVRADPAGTGFGDVTAQVDRSTPFPSVEISGGGPDDLRFVAFHSVAPTPGDVPQWRSDLASLDRWCGQPGPVIIAGDFNATLDHSVFRSAITGCADAAEQAGGGLTASWPTRWPRWLGPQIDHVLVTGGITAETLSVHDIPGSDHRAVVTRLRLP